MSHDPSPHSTSPSTRARSLPLAGTVSVWPASTIRAARPRPVRATTLLWTRVTSSHGTVRSCASRWSVMAPSWWLTEGISTSSAVKANKSVMGSDHDAVVAEDLVEVLALAGRDAADDQCARQPELAARELAPAARLHDDRSGRHHPPPDLLAGLGVDHRDPLVQDHGLAEHAAGADAGALGDHAAAPDHAVVADHHRRRLRRLEYAADADPAGQVDIGADLSARAHRGPRVDHRVGTDAGPDVDVARHQDHAPAEERAPARRRAGHHPDPLAEIVVLERDLVGVLERPELDRLHLREAEEQQDRLLEPFVHPD